MGFYFRCGVLLFAVLSIVISAGCPEHSSAQQPVKRRRLLFIGQSMGWEHDSVSYAAGTIWKLGHDSGLWETYIYTDLAEQIAAKIYGRLPDSASLVVPTVDDGVAEMRFIAAAIESSKKNSAWVGVSEAKV